MKQVICIGDSIRMGYEPTVVRQLEGWAQVVELGDRQCGNTRVVLELLEEVLRDDLDVVHINAGLHDMARDPAPEPGGQPGEERRVPLEEYGRNLARIFDIIAARTQARIVFGLTTPVDLSRQEAVGKGIHRTPDDVAAYNRTAGEIGARHRVTIDDLHQVIIDHGAGDLLGEDGVHFTAAGSEVLGRAVAAAVRQVAA